LFGFREDQWLAHYRKSVDTAFFEKWSPGMAYVVGYFAGDGSMYVNPNGSRYIEFTSIDYIQLEHVRKLLSAEHQIRLRRRNKAGPGWKPAFRVQIGGDELFEQLSRLGFTPNKDQSLVFPRVPADCVGSFVRGYFDGDGCISFGWYQQPNRNKKPLFVQAMFSSGSFTFLKALDLAIQAATGISPGYLRERKVEGHYLCYQRRKELPKLYYFMYPADLSPDQYLARKRLRFQEALAVLGA
jgi:hypothetical protein